MGSRLLNGSLQLSRTVRIFPVVLLPTVTLGTIGEPTHNETTYSIYTKVRSIMCYVCSMPARIMYVYIVYSSYTHVVRSYVCKNSYMYVYIRDLA